MLINKNESPLQNISFISISTAILLVLVSISRFVPFCFLILSFIVPLLSALTFIFTKPKYFIIYLIASLLLSFALTFDMFNETIFYVIPGLLIGGVIGLSIRYNFHVYYIIFIASIFKMALEMVSIPLINLMYEVNMYTTFTTLLSLNNYQFTYLFIPLILMLFSMVETIITIAIISIPLNTFKTELNVSSEYTINNPSLSMLLSVFSLIFIFAHPMFQSLSIIFAAVSMYFSLPSILNLNRKSKKIIISFAVTVFLTILSFVLIFNYLRSPFSILVFLVIPNYINISSLFLYKKKLK